MKKLIIRIAIGLVALLVAALAVVFFSLNSLVKKGVETIGPELTKVPIRVGSANLSPLSGGGRLTGLFVGNPEGYKSPSAIQIGDIKVGVRIGSLLSDKVVLNEVNIQAPEITFEGGLGGNNLSKIMANVDAATSGSKDKKDEKTGRRFEVKDLLIRGGKINVSVPGWLGKSATVALPEIHLTNVGAGGGVTAAELTQRVLKELLATTTKAATAAVTDLSKGVKDLGKDGTSQLEKSAKGITDLFKKKK